MPTISTLTLTALLAAALAVPVQAASVTYTIDPDHTQPSFEFPHMGISIWRGKFTRTSGTIALDRAAKTGSVDIVVDTASIDFGHEEMEKHARGKGWFDVATYPQATYQGRIAFDGDVPKTINGQFTFRGVTKPVTLAIRQFGCIPHPMTKKEVCGADAEGELNWSDYGMEKSQWGQGAAGRTVLRIQVEATP